MNITYYRIEMRRLLRDFTNMFFTAGLPAFLYMIFGAGPEYGSDPIRDGNVAMFIMIAMAAYGAVTATTGIGGSVAVERMQGWTRQLGLTPMSDRDYVTVKAAVAATIAAVPILLIYVLGYLTGAKAPLSVWLASGLIVLIGAVTFALYGLNFGLAFRSEAAVSAAGGSLVILSFLGNIFIPLSGWQLAVAKFTPLYGLVSLARRSLTGGGTLDVETGNIIDVPLWQPLTNVIVWTTVFAVVAIFLTKRSRTRQ